MRILLTGGTGYVETALRRELQELGQDRVTLSNQWGREPILCEGIPAQIKLPVAAERVQFFALDEAGNRRDAIPVNGSANHAELQLGPENKTVWYEVVIRGE